MTDKHLDKLFADALAGAERKPSSAAWERVEARLATRQQQRRPLWGWYMAAAATVSALLIGAYFYGNPNPETSAAATTTQKTQVAKPTISEPLYAEKLATKNIANSPVDTKTGTNSKRNDTFNTEEASNASIEKKSVGVSDNILTDDKTLANLNSQTESNTLAVSEAQANLITTPISNAQPENGGNTPNTKLPTPNTQASSSVLVFNIKEADEVLSQVNNPKNEKKKPFRLGKFLKNLREFGNGEEVNWQESGVNPPQLLAKADEGIEQSREKLTETYRKIKTGKETQR